MYTTPLPHISRKQGVKSSINNRLKVPMKDWREEKWKHESDPLKFGRGNVRHLRFCGDVLERAMQTEEPPGTYTTYMLKRYCLTLKAISMIFNDTPMIPKWAENSLNATIWYKFLFYDNY